MHRLVMLKANLVFDILDKLVTLFNICILQKNKKGNFQAQQTGGLKPNHLESN